MRLFIAIDLPDSVKDWLGEIIAELSACRADVRWVHTDSMHLTLKFLGNVEAQELAAIDGVLKKIASTAQPTQGRLRNLGSFPHLCRPRVLWIGVEPIDERLPALHAGLDGRLAKIGFSKEQRRFHPHISLGRVRGNRRLTALQEVIENQAGIKARSFAIEHLTLFESALRRTGPHYTALGTYSFRARQRSRPVA